MFESFMGLIIVIIMGTMFAIALKSTVQQDDSDDQFR